MTRILLFLLTLLFLNLEAQTFTKSLGISGVNDGATSICPSQNGFYISGYADDIAYIAAIDENGTMLWRADYDFTEQLDLITHISLAGNKLLGCGYGYAEGSAQFLEFFFKYDLESKTFDWVKRSAMNLKPATIQLLPNGKYLLTGDEYGVQSFRMFLMEIDPNSGKSTLYSSYVFSGRESASTAVIHNNFIYTGGRYGLEAKIDKYRGAISKFDLNFNEVWSNYYLNYKDKFLRNYLSKILVDEEHLISLFFTNNHGVNSFYTACLAKQTLDGELVWASEFSLEDYRNLTVKDIKATADAYYIYGYTKSPTEELFLIKTDKEGNAVWAKTYGGRFNDNLAIDQGNFIEIKAENIYMIGQSMNISKTNDYDGLFMKLNLDGSSDGTCWEKDIDVKTTQFEELIQGEIFLSRKDSSFRFFNLGYKKEKFSTDLDFSYVCFPKLAVDDVDTVFAEKSIEINFLKNDITPSNEKINHKIISNPVYGSARIEAGKMVYTRTKSNVCALDSFQYELASAVNGKDTATIFIYTHNEEDVNPKLVNLVLKEKGNMILDATSSLVAAKYMWNTGETTQSISINKPGNYSVQTINNACIYKKTITVEENPYSFDNVATTNISFLLDASSSMNRSNRLPILKNSLYKIMNFMRSEDKLSMVKFSSEAEIIFNGINANDIEKVQSKIDNLDSEGRSNLKQGFKLAYETAKSNFVAAGNNRIIMTTDGDIPTAEREELIEYIKKTFPENTKLSIFLFNDASLFKTQMEAMAKAVNGSLYVITPENVEKVLLKELKAVRKASF